MRCATAAAEGRVFASLTRKQAEFDPFPAIAAHCYMAGYDLSIPMFDGAANSRGVPLYPLGGRGSGSTLRSKPPIR